MAQYRVKRKRIVRPEGVAEPGDVIEARDAEVRAFGDNLERVSDADADADAEPARDADDADADEQSEDESVVDTCGAELSSGGTCDRPAATCPYHDTESED